MPYSNSIIGSRVAFGLALQFPDKYCSIEAWEHIFKKKKYVTEEDINMIRMSNLAGLRAVPNHFHPLAHISDNFTFTYLINSDATYERTKILWDVFSNNDNRKKFFGVTDIAKLERDGYEIPLPKEKDMYHSSPSNKDEHIEQLENTVKTQKKEIELLKQELLSLSKSEKLDTVNPDDTEKKKIKSTYLHKPGKN